jgi:predicted transcriptional regulator
MEQQHQNGHSSQNKSARIRALAVAGKPISEIAREVGVRYQFAYNVVRHENLVKKTESKKYPRIATWGLKMTAY